MPRRNRCSDGLKFSVNLLSQLPNRFDPLTSQADLSCSQQSHPIRNRCTYCLAIFSGNESRAYSSKISATQHIVFSLLTSVKFSRCPFAATSFDCCRYDTSACQEERIGLLLNKL